MRSSPTCSGSSPASRSCSCRCAPTFPWPAWTSRPARDRELAWKAIRDGFSRYAQPGASVAVVCFTADRQTADEVGRDFADRLDTIGIATRTRLWADETRWADLDSGDMGLQTEAARERVAAMAVVDGRAQPATSRESLAQSLVGDREPVAELLPEARQAASESTPRAEESWALGRLQRFRRDGERLSDFDAARLLVAVESIPIRDRLWTAMDRSSAASHVALWTDMTRRAPDDVRAAPAALLGFASWLSGNGARAWCALDQVPRDTPYALANLVATTVRTGMHPREWEAVKSRPSERGTHRVAAVTPIWPSHQPGQTRPARGI